MKMKKQLIEISKNIRTQGNRCTRECMFMVSQMVQVTRSEGCGREVERLSSEYCTYCDKCQEKEGEGDLPDYCHSCDSDCFYHFDWERQVVAEPGLFFTEKACEEHIECNDYHYRKPKSYGVHAWRNEEMKVVRDFLLSLTEPNKFSIGLKFLRNIFRS